MIIDIKNLIVDFLRHETSRAFSNLKTEKNIKLIEKWFFVISVRSARSFTKNSSRSL